MKFSFSNNRKNQWHRFKVISGRITGQNKLPRDQEWSETPAEQGFRDSTLFSPYLHADF